MIIRLKNGKEMKIRKATKDDADAMIKFINKISEESDFITISPGEFQMPIDKEEMFIKAFDESDNKLFIIAVVDNEIVGNLTFNGLDRKRVRHSGEFGISVVKEYWGLGIGYELMEHMIKWAKETGIIRKINLKVRSDNSRGVKLYRKLGFKIEGEISRDFLIEGKFYSSYVMGLEIDSNGSAKKTKK